MPHFCSLPWTPFRECWKSAAVLVLDLILIEVYGKCQFVVDMLNLSFFFKRFPFPLSFGNLNVSCHGGRPWIAALCFSCVFAAEISGSLFVSGQHVSGPHRDQRRVPTALGVVCKQVQYPLLSPLLVTVLLTNCGEWRCVYPGTELSPPLHLKHAGFIFYLFKCFDFRVNMWFFRLLVIWHFGVTCDQTLPWKLTSLFPAEQRLLLLRWLAFNPFLKLIYLF